MPKLFLITERWNNSSSNLAKWVDILPGFTLNIGNKKIVPVFPAPGSLQLCRGHRDIQIIIAQCGKGSGCSRRNTGTQSRDRVSGQSREGLAEVTIFESGLGRQMEFQQTGRREINCLSSEKQLPSKRTKTWEHCGLWERDGEVL